QTWDVEADSLKGHSTLERSRRAIAIATHETRPGSWSPMMRVVLCRAAFARARAIRAAICSKPIGCSHAGRLEQELHGSHEWTRIESRRENCPGRDDATKREFTQKEALASPARRARNQHRPARARRVQPPSSRLVSRQRSGLALAPYPRRVPRARLRADAPADAGVARRELLRRVPRALPYAGR